MKKLLFIKKHFLVCTVSFFAVLWSIGFLAEADASVSFTCFAGLVFFVSLFTLTGYFHAIGNYIMDNFIHSNPSSKSQ